MPPWKRNLYVCWFGVFATMLGSSLVIPFLPLYIEQLGVHSTGSIEQWSGIAYGATFLISAIVTPTWGKLADQHGRKLMLLRASMGIAICMALMGFAQNVYELVALRLLMGSVSGYNSAAITLVATETPKGHAGWALGTLSSGFVGGALLGPLIGGWLAELCGFRNVFFVTAGIVSLAFLGSWILVHEEFTPANESRLSNRQVWSMIANPKVLISMFLTTFMIQFANFSIEPIITVYVKQLLQNATHVALISGIVVSASGFASVFAAPQLGKVSDRVGARKVLLACLILGAIAFIPQAFVQNPWQLTGLRFVLGIAAAGLLPSVNSIVKRNTPGSITGRVFGFCQSFQYLGTVAGPLLGGTMAAYYGIHYVFFSTCLLLLINAVWVYTTGKTNIQDRALGANM